MKIIDLKQRAALWGVPKGWQLNEDHTELVRIPEGEAGFRPEADHHTQQQLEQYYRDFEQKVAIDPNSFSESWQRERNNHSQG